MNCRQVLRILLQRRGLCGTHRPHSPYTGYAPHRPPRKGTETYMKWHEALLKRTASRESAFTQSASNRPAQSTTTAHRPVGTDIVRGFSTLVLRSPKLSSFSSAVGSGIRS
ncbi:unnamed protein product [Soboliphyme baturini]|uniref:Uncharacterized protein n=1 Tax=Soboliphyme baturini TaxID=241478 RepID=A0A183IKS8_9BILA|nr:unnamed protein product [Soboliphyme baturini]